MDKTQWIFKMKFADLYKLYGQKKDGRKPSLIA
jgi:hypothetical protein